VYRSNPRRTSLRATLLAALLMPMGCTSLDALKLPEPSASGPAETVKLTYRTDSDRLNLLVALEPPAGQLVSYQQPRSPVPDFTESTLHLTYPHPGGRAGYALATVVFEAQPSGDSSDSGVSAIWKKITGSSDEAAPGANGDPGFREVWTTDVPRWQLDRVVAKLRESGYFRRTKTLNAKVSLATEIDGARFGKDFTELPELDAIIVRIRSQGRPVVATRGLDGMPSPRAEIRRLPPA